GRKAPGGPWGEGADGWRWAGTEQSGKEGADGSLEPMRQGVFPGPAGLGWLGGGRVGDGAGSR
ncbi:unnamed protein product, partial [Bubo scandiacus]